MSLRSRQRFTLPFLATVMSLSPTLAEESAVEAHEYKFPYKEIFGKSKHRVGDYAEIVHKVSSISAKSNDRYNYKARRSLWIEIVTSDAATLRFDAKLVEKGHGEDNASLFDEILEELVGMQFGWEKTIQRTARGTLSTSIAPEVTWEFAAARYSPNKEPGSVTALLVHGDRRIEFVEKELGFVDVYEAGVWLSSGANREYTFRQGLNPGLKLVLLGGMEAVKISGKFHDSLH